jgi:two-component system, cell cycle response regulator DivK
MTKVLLVEDNEMSRDMLSRRLIRRGFEVVFAVDGKQGVDAARREKPDIILMDMSLPIMDGWEATRCVKSDDAMRGVPVIGLTARAMSGDREKAIEAGCDDYDTKPVELDRLIGEMCPPHRVNRTRTPCACKVAATRSPPWVTSALYSILPKRVLGTRLPKLNCKRVQARQPRQ